MTKTLMLASAATIALLASPALAQSPATPAIDSDAPAEIVVTAQKRTERLQDVPVAVTVVSGDALEAQGRVNLEGAVNLVPSFNFLKSGTAINQSLFLRGVGTATFSIAGEPSVSTVVDGVVYSRSGEAFSELVDVDRLEVLRGPQGTLFGKNASAGVINITSKRPTTEFEGYGEVGYYSGNDWRLRGAVNAPLGGGIGARLNAFYSSYDGNIFNTAVNRKVNGWDRWGARLQIGGELSSTVSMLLSADYHENRDNCCAQIPGTPPIAGGTGLPTTSLITAALPTPLGDETRTINQNLITAANETGYAFSGQFDFDAGFATITSITAYRNWKNTEIRDGDWVDRSYIGFPQLHDFGPQTGDTFTQELRLTSSGKQTIDYVVGGFYSVADSTRTFTRNIARCNALTPPAPTVLTPCSSPLAAPQTFPSGTALFGSKFTNFAVFGQATLNISAAFRLIAGLRYTSDKLSVFHARSSVNLDTAGGVPTATSGVQPNFDQGVFDRYNALVASGLTAAAAQAQSPLGSNGVPFRTRTTNNNLSGKVGAQFDLSDNNMLYGTYARGYKGPAYNIFFNLSATGTNTIAAETSDAFEIGLKNTLAGGRVVINLAAFYTKYFNFQANNPDLVAGVVVSRFTNAGKVSTRGFEADVLFRPVRDLSIAGGIAYTDARVDAFIAAPGATAAQIIPSGTPLGYAPKWKGSLSVDYRIRSLDAVDFTLGAQGNFQTSQLSLFSPDAIQRQLGTIGGYGLVNLSAAIVAKDDRWRIGFQVRNVFDQSFAAAIANGGPGGAYLYQIPRDADRYFGVTARINFGAK